ncbi:MAG: hypothetical protein WC476_01640 [Phycisphaerae bacterium]
MDCQFYDSNLKQCFNRWCPASEVPGKDLKGTCCFYCSQKNKCKHCIEVCPGYPEEKEYVWVIYQHLPGECPNICGVFKYEEDAEKYYDEHKDKYGSFDYELYGQTMYKDKVEIE